MEKPTTTEEAATARIECDDLFGKWSPVETAPKDGTPVIVGYDCASVWIVHLAWWRTLEEWMTYDPEWSEEDVGWWSYVENSVSQHKLDGLHAPTHWMPCPSLPNHRIGHTEK